MLTLYSYPSLLGVADNNGYGLKVYAFLKLAGVPFRHERVVDGSAAPRGQLPYIIDDGETIGDSDAIIAYVIRKYRLTFDEALSQEERDRDLLVARMLDHLYWVIGYSRWQDDQYFPAFRDAAKRVHPQLTDESLGGVREFNMQRYHFQGIGRYPPEAVYAEGIADLSVLARLIPARGFVHGEKPTSVDANVYGFVANIYLFAIDTPLKRCVEQHESLVRHCKTVHAIVSREEP